MINLQKNSDTEEGARIKLRIKLLALAIKKMKHVKFIFNITEQYFS